MARARPTLLHFAFLAMAPGPEGDNRRRVFLEIQAHPGLHQAEVARALGLSETTTEHHLHNLVATRLLVRQEQGGFVRYYPAVHGVTAKGAVPPTTRPRLAVLRQTRPLQIAAQLLQEDGLPMQVLAGRVGLTPSAATYQVAKMERVGLVRRASAGPERRVFLADRPALIELLLAYEPPADLIAGFEALWKDLGF